MDSKSNNYPYEDGRVPISRYGINLGLGVAVAVLIGFQRVYEAVNFKMIMVKPTLVSFISCAFMFLIFTPIVIYRHGWVGVSYIYKTRSWLYLVFALLEIQGYYMYNFAIIDPSINIYVYILSGTVGISTLILSRFILRTRFKPLHLIGSLLCFLGVFFLCMSEGSFVITLSKTTTISAIVTYMGCAISSVILYSLSYISLESALRQFTIPETLMFYGFYGMVINFLTIIFMDRYQLEDNWQGETGAKTAAILLTVLCKSFELIIACFLILSSNSVLYSHSKTICRLFFTLFTHFGIKLLDAVQITWYLIAGAVVYYVGFVLLGIFHMPVGRERTHFINFFRRP